MMKKSVLALIFSASVAFAATNGVPQPEWSHTNSSGPIVGLIEVRYPINPSSAKSDDRVKFTVDSTGTREDDGGYRYLGDGARQPVCWPMIQVPERNGIP